MIVRFEEFNLVINTQAFSHAAEILGSDDYPDKKHVIVYFTNGLYFEFPPETMTLQYFYHKMRQGE